MEQSCDKNANDEILHIELYTVNEQGNVVLGVGSACTEIFGAIIGAILYGICVYKTLRFFACGAAAATVAAFICSYFCKEKWTWCSLGGAFFFCGYLSTRVPGGELVELVFGYGCDDACNALLGRFC